MFPRNTFISGVRTENAAALMSNGRLRLAEPRRTMETHANSSGLRKQPQVKLFPF